MRQKCFSGSQLDLLLDARSASYSDFYSYRYFASEGFLPGYNFPRLPLSAYIPGRRGRRNEDRDEFLSRPRFLAISEFGPRSIIYHEGSRYVINRAILPVSDNGVLTSKAKVCEACGYLHPIADQSDGPDLCENCDTLLPQVFSSLFRMQNHFRIGPSDRRYPPVIPSEVGIQVAVMRLRCRANSISARY